MNLILSETPLSLFQLGAGERPGVAVTYATAKGEIRRAGATLIGLGYRFRYEIDISDHHDAVQWSLPSKDERLFTVRIGLGWRVFDPCVVTTRRVNDGLSVLMGYLHPVVRRMSREHEIEQLHDLEDKLNHLVSAGPARFNEGLEVYHVDAQLDFDEKTVNHAAAVRNMDRDYTVAGLRHVAELSTARSQIDVDRLRHRAIEQMVAGENGLLIHHLTVHRDDTMGVVKVLQQQDQTSMQARARLLEQFQDRLLPEELDGLAELLVRATKDSIEQSTTPQLGRPQAFPAVVAALPPSPPDVVSRIPLRIDPEPPAPTPAPAPSEPAATATPAGDNVAEWRPVPTDNGQRG